MPFISNGTTILDNGAFSVGLGSLVLLSTQTASASASLSFTSGLDSTYKAYKFEFINMHPATDNVHFQFNFSTDSGSSYNVTKTTTAFTAYHNEADTQAGLTYEAGFDLAQSTSFQSLCWYTGSDADQANSGSMTLFNPSSTTYVKHYLSDMDVATQDNALYRNTTAGYGNTTSAVNAVQFKMSSGNMDAGTIKLYGIKDS